MDLPDGAAGEVDRELQPDLAAGQWRQEDENEAWDRDGKADQVEPAALAD
jgi:hypothetical protein